MRCVKTGSLMALPDYNAMANGDLFVVGKCYVFWHCPFEYDRDDVPKEHIYGTISLATPDHFMRETKPFSVIVVPMGNVTFNPHYEGYKHYE